MGAFFVWILKNGPSRCAVIVFVVPNWLDLQVIAVHQICQFAGSVLSFVILKFIFKSNQTTNTQLQRIEMDKVADIEKILIYLRSEKLFLANCDRCLMISFVTV